jgi:hypothetical protein
MKVLKWLRQFLKKFKKKKEIINPCSTCVWWRAEDENLVNFHRDSEMRFCDKHKLFTHQDITCPEYLEEKFEATENSVQTKEYEINHEMSVEQNDPRDEKK